MTIGELNGLNDAEFAARIGWVFEQSPWVCERTVGQRPFESLDQLCEGLNAQVLMATWGEQIALLRAHPDLATKARMARSSVREQAGVGLDRLTAGEYERFKQLNTAYSEKFGFPFLFAVKGSNKFAIMGAMQRRLESTVEEEFAEGLRQVFRIARFRLEEIVT